MKLHNRFWQDVFGEWQNVLSDDAGPSIEMYEEWTRRYPGWEYGRLDEHHPAWRDAYAATELPMNVYYDWAWANTRRRPAGPLPPEWTDWMFAKAEWAKRTRYGAHPVAQTVPPVDPPRKEEKKEEKPRCKPSPKKKPAVKKKPKPLFIFDKPPLPEDHPPKWWIELLRQDERVYASMNEVAALRRRHGIEPLLSPDDEELPEELYITHPRSWSNY